MSDFVQVNVVNVVGVVGVVGVVKTGLKVRENRCVVLMFSRQRNIMDELEFALQALSLCLAQDACVALRPEMDCCFVRKISWLDKP